MVYIYVLLLENDKYYIGKTESPNFRLETHFTLCGSSIILSKDKITRGSEKVDNSVVDFRRSSWTKKYKPIKILELIPNCDDLDEDKYTIRYMKDKGIVNVRGGSFCELKLSKENIITLRKMINSADDKCYICGTKGHFANNCKSEKLYIFDSDDDDESDSEEEYNVITKKKYYNKYGSERNNNKCYRCGRKGHLSYNCYAESNINGYYLS